MTRIFITDHQNIQFSSQNMPFYFHTLYNDLDLHGIDSMDYSQ